jgi:hypothetical protein
LHRSFLAPLLAAAVCGPAVALAAEGAGVPATVEALLVRAASDPAVLPELYDKVLASDLFLIMPEPPPQAGPQHLTAGTSIELVHGKGPSGAFLPMFSSLRSLKAWSGDKRYAYLVMNGREAFGLVAEGSVAVILDPGRPHEHTLAPSDVQLLAEGIHPGTGKQMLEADVRISIGPPDEYPHAVVSRLRALFETRPEVAAAYIASIVDPSIGRAPRLLVGVDCDGDAGPIVADARAALGSLGADNPPVDFTEVGSANPSLDAYFKDKAEPFYRRPKKSGV